MQNLPCHQNSELPQGSWKDLIQKPNLPPFQTLTQSDLHTKSIMRVRKNCVNQYFLLNSNTTKWWCIQSYIHSIVATWSCPRLDVHLLIWNSSWTKHSANKRSKESVPSTNLKNLSPAPHQLSMCINTSAGCGVLVSLMGDTHLLALNICYVSEAAHEWPFILFCHQHYI